MYGKNKKQALILSIVGVLTLKYIKRFFSVVQHIHTLKVDVTTATTDLLTI